MLNQIKLCLALGLLTIPGLSMAAGDLRYTYFEVNYMYLSIDPFDEDGFIFEEFDDGNGVAFRGSFAFTDNFFIFGGYSIVDSEATFVDRGTVLFTSDRDVKRLDIGAGFNTQIFQTRNSQTDIVARVAYSDIDYGEFNFGAGVVSGLRDLNDDSSDGFFADVALRSQMMTWLELSGGVRYTKIEDADSFSFIGNALFELTPNWGLNLEIDAGSDIKQVMLGVRFSFAGR